MLIIKRIYPKWCLVRKWKTLIILYSRNNNLLYILPHTIDYIYVSCICVVIYPYTFVACLFSHSVSCTFFYVNSGIAITILMLVQKCSYGCTIICLTNFLFLDIYIDCTVFILLKCIKFSRKKLYMKGNLRHYNGNIAKTINKTESENLKI